MSQHETGAERGHVPPVGDAGSKPQALLEYEAAIAGCRLEHLITLSALGFRRGCWSRDGTAKGHLKTLDRLCREYVRGK